jgi:hypothetical protein
MVIRYSEKPQVHNGTQRTNVWSRFPANIQTMASVPVSGSQPIKLFQADGRARWGVQYLGAWREVERYRDPRTGQYSVRMNGSQIIPVAWASS